MRYQQLPNDQVVNSDFRLKFFSSSNFTIFCKTHYKISPPGEIKTRLQPQTLSITNCDCACLS
jgi:hypothetical protein